MADYAVYLGAEDWRHPEWVGELYPEEMPEEWHLAYYGSQFRCVYLERAVWSAASPEVRAQWAEDVPAGFRFLLEGAGPEAVVPGGRAVPVAGRDDPRLLWFGAGDDLRALAAGIRARASGEGLYLLSRDGDLKRIEEMQTLVELLGL